METLIDSGLVSIVMPMHNDSNFVMAAIQSVLSQTYSDFELLIINDCSTDDSLFIAQSFLDNRIRIFCNDVNHGAAYSRNIALENAKGRWIAFLDADDRWEPQKLEKQIHFMEEASISFSFTSYWEERDGILQSLVRGPKKVNKRKMFSCDYLGCLTVMYDRLVIGDLHVDERIKRRNDYALWLDASKKANCYLLDQPLAVYTVRKGSLSRVSICSLLKSHFLLFRIQEGFPWAVAWLFAVRNGVLATFKKCLFKKRLSR